MTNQPGGYPPQYPGYPPPPHQQGYPSYPPPGYEGYPQQQAAPQWPAQYEFSEQENKTIERCAAWAKALAVLNYVMAGLQVINLNIVGIIINVGIGIAFWRASKSLADVVETQGNDVQHLMSSLKSISAALMIRLVLVAVGLGVVLLVGLIVAVVFLAV
jgi:hypothetical protein